MVCSWMKSSWDLRAGHVFCLTYRGRSSARRSHPGFATGGLGGEAAPAQGQDQVLEGAADRHCRRFPVDPSRSSGRTPTTGLESLLRRTHHVCKTRSDWSYVLGPSDLVTQSACMKLLPPGCAWFCFVFCYTHAMLLCFEQQ